MAFIPAAPVATSSFRSVSPVTRAKKSARRVSTSVARRSPPVRRLLVCEASPPSSTEEVPEERTPPFEIRGFSLANLFLGTGGLITISSFFSYISSAGTASATSIGFVYGVPILLVGCALKYAELQPVEVTSELGARNARGAKATEVQRKIYSDITRHRYGDEAHLSAALSSLGLIPRGEPCPVLERATERVADGEYEMELVFTSVATPYKDWTARIDRYERFFGPGITASVRKIDPQLRLVGLTLRTGERTSPVVEVPVEPDAEPVKEPAMAETDEAQEAS